MSVLISPSILSANFANLGEDIQLLENSGADMIHFDIMDGTFVPNITIGSCILAATRAYTKLPFDVHLMINNPAKHIESFVKSGADIITIHPETETHLDRVIDYIKSFGVKVGIAINPGVHENILEYVLEKIDLVLVMSVNPGFGGQVFLESQLRKIANIRRMIDLLGKDIILEVDGGINAETAKIVKTAGANALVSGSYIFQDRAQNAISSKINLLKN